MQILLTLGIEVSAFSYIISTVGSSPSWELGLSILAIIISVVTAVVGYIVTKKINVTNLESEFYKEIYFDYLMKKIPAARQEIRFNDNMVRDVEGLTDVLNAMRRDSLFFRYKDNDFYEELKGLLQALENYLVGKNNANMDTDDFLGVNNTINSKIEEIYDCIMKQYKG